MDTPRPPEDSLRRMASVCVLDSTARLRIAASWRSLMARIWSSSFFRAAFSLVALRPYHNRTHADRQVSERWLKKACHELIPQPRTGRCGLG